MSILEKKRAIVEEEFGQESLRVRGWFVCLTKIDTKSSARTDVAEALAGWDLWENRILLSKVFCKGRPSIEHIFMAY